MGNEPVSAARASSVACGLAASPGQGPVPAEQDLREAFRGFLAGPVPLQLTPHLGTSADGSRPVLPSHPRWTRGPREARSLPHPISG